MRIRRPPKIKPLMVKALEQHKYYECLLSGRQVFITGFNHSTAKGKVFNEATGNYDVIEFDNFELA